MQKLKQDRVVVCHAIVKGTKDPKELHACGHSEVVSSLTGLISVSTGPHLS